MEKVILFVEEKLADIEKMKLALNNLKLRYGFLTARKMMIALGMMVLDTTQRKKFLIFLF